MYDVIVIGSGPGGYAAAIRAASGSGGGLKTALIERAELGGTCLNWGCIPTKALLKSAEVYRYALHAGEYGIDIQTDAVRLDLGQVVARSRAVAEQMSKGVDFLMKKNGIDVIYGTGALTTVQDQVCVRVASADGSVRTIEAKHIILATGARAREMAAIPVDGHRVITARHALTMTTLPGSMVIVGSGAIGLEFAHFYNTLGVKVTVVEYAPTLAPLEDEEISKLLDRSLRKSKISTMTGTEVKGVIVRDSRCYVTVEGKRGPEVLEADMVLSAVGVVANIEGLGLEEVGIKTERGRVIVDEHYRTNVAGVYAIGDIIPGPALAHVATAEALHCADFIAAICRGDGSDNSVDALQPVDYSAVPSCIYTVPEVSSVGLTEAQATAAGHTLRIGRFPYTASGKATAAGNRDGLVKLIFDADTDKLLGAHLFGLSVTELIAEPTLAMHLGATASDIIRTIHAHPTMAEALLEAAEQAHNQAVHL